MLNLAELDKDVTNVGRGELLARLHNAVAEGLRLKNDHDAMVDTLGGVQRRCTDLLTELRAQRRFVREPATQIVLADVVVERMKGDLRHGTAAEHVNRPDGTSLDEEVTERLAREACQAAERDGVCTWRHILWEEVAESFAAVDPTLLRKELIQVASTALKWAEAIDLRTAAVSG